MRNSTLASVQSGSRSLRVVVNATALGDAGGRACAINFLRAVPVVAPHHRFIVLAPVGAGYEELQSANVEFRWVPSVMRRELVRPFTDSWWVGRQVRTAEADVLFSMGFIGVNSGQTPQLLLFQWPYAIYPESPVWRAMGFWERTSRRLRLFAFRRGLRFVNRVCVQTPTARARLHRHFRAPDSVIVPNAVSLGAPESLSSGSPIIVGRRQRVRLLALTRYYPHKNLEVLLEVARRLLAADHDVHIYLTIDSSHGRDAARLIRRLEDPSVSAAVSNLGIIPMNRVHQLYSEVDGLILPTRLESFSGTYAESMFFGKTILTSDLDFARDVCGEAAFYFDPDDAQSIVGAIDLAFRDTAERHRRAELGRRRVAEMPDWYQVSRMFVEEIESLAGGVRTRAERRV